MRTARRRRCMPPAIAPSVDATIAMFQPEIATTWLAPAVVKAAARSRSTRSRSPISTPAASPASGSGIDRSIPAAAARRKPSSVCATVPSAGAARASRRGACRSRRCSARYVAVLVRRRRTDAAAELDPIARDDGRIPGQGRRHEDGPACRRDERSPVARPARGAPTVWTRPIHGPSPVGIGPGAGATSPAEAARRPMTRTPIASGARPREPGARPTARAATGRARQRRAEQRHDQRRQHAEREGARGGADRQPRRTRHAQPTVTSARIFSNVFSPTSPRSRSSSTVLNGAPARDSEDLLGGHRADPGQRLELRLGRRVQVDERPPPGSDPPPPPPLPPPPPAPPPVATASSRDGTRTWAPSFSVAARLSSAPDPVDVDPRAEPARGIDGIADPRSVGEVVHAGRDDRASDVDDDLADRRGRRPRCRSHRARRPVRRSSRRPRPTTAITTASPPIARAPTTPAIASAGWRVPGAPAVACAAVALPVVPAPPPASCPAGASNTRHGGDDWSTTPRPAGCGRALTRSAGKVVFGGRLVQCSTGSTGDSAGRKLNVPSVGALRRTGRRREPYRPTLICRLSGGGTTVPGVDFAHVHAHRDPHPQTGIPRRRHRLDATTGRCRSWCGRPPPDGTVAGDRRRPTRRPLHLGVARGIPCRGSGHLRGCRRRPVRRVGSRADREPPLEEA